MAILDGSRGCPPWSILSIFYLYWLSGFKRDDLNVKANDIGIDRQYNILQHKLIWPLSSSAIHLCTLNTTKKQKKIKSILNIKWDNVCI